MRYTEVTGGTSSGRAHKTSAHGQPGIHSAAQCFIKPRCVGEQKVNITTLAQEHAVTITEKPVPRGHSMTVGGQHPLAASKGADEHEKAGLGEMKIC